MKKRMILSLLMLLNMIAMTVSGQTVLHYKFQEKSPGHFAYAGDTIVSVIGRNAVVAGGDLDYVNGPQPGMGALLFEADNGGDRLVISGSSDFAIPYGQSITLEAIVNIGTLTDTMAIIAQDGGSGSSEEWWWRVENGKPRWFVVGGSKNASFYATSAINDAQWHHLAAIIDGTNKRLIQYVDGQLSGSVDMSQVTSTIGSAMRDVYIGEFLSSGARDLAGKIAEVRITRGVVDPSEFLRMEVPIGAHQPDPEDGAIDVASAGTEFSWATGQDPNLPGVDNPAITGHQFWLGIDPNDLTLMTTTTSNSYTPTLLKDTPYFWRVDEMLSDGGVVWGDLWSFESEISIPQIDRQPVDTYVYVGEDALFDFEASEPNGKPLTFQWFYDPNQATSGDEIALADGVRYSGVTTTQLTVASISEADTVGVFWCEIRNNAIITTESVSIKTKHLIAHWQLNEGSGDTAGDSSGNGLDGALVGSPSWVEGKLDGALQFGTDRYVDLSERLESFTELATGTITTWIKVASSGGAQVILAMSDDTQASREFRLFFEVDDLRLGSRGGLVNTSISDISGLKDNQWHLVAATHDDSGLTTIYVDGRQVKSGETGWFNNFEPGQINFMAIGMNKDNGGIQWPFPGVIDDVRVYDFALSASEIADLWVAVESPICTEIPLGDLNGDCVVTLSDFAILTANWLECNRVPTDSCQ